MRKLVLIWSLIWIIGPYSHKWTLKDKLYLKIDQIILIPYDFHLAFVWVVKSVYHFNSSLALNELI